ncbi:MBL fold metallo-hydrolase [uncultured Bartonella sp.]|uniref:MBL fold metallo-hydrolase n=1 Tax=uncultured Bartonella sp. TaxID=104108 RepID=UPI0025D8D454|nr:MBL fold metallo-hydrolase [uncultured Bartonella sp.]
MHDRYKFTILGCGSSPGVPRANGDWGACNPDNPKNYRYRASILIERIKENGERTTVVVDTGPDFRSQMVDHNVHEITSVVYTHPHADHIHGIDDLRTYAISQHHLMNVYADDETYQRLYEAFGYCFKTPEGSNYPPILNRKKITPYEKFTIDGKGGPITLLPVFQIHGDIHSLGFRLDNVAYCTDVNEFPEKTPKYLENLDVLIIGALQYRTHPSHFSVDQAVEWGQKLNAKRVILTHMHIALDYDEVMKYTPDNVEPAYQGLTFEVDAK